MMCWEDSSFAGLSDLDFPLTRWADLLQTPRLLVVWHSRASADVRGFLLTDEAVMAEGYAHTAEPWRKS